MFAWGRNVTRTFKVTTRPVRTCAECGQEFAAHHGRQKYCIPEHKAAFEQRNRDRGKIMMPLILVWRAGKKRPSAERNYAFSQLCAAADVYNQQDRAAGRQPAVIVQDRMAESWSAADLR